MKKVKVLFVIGQMNEGGGQHMVYELIKYLDQNIYEVIILCYEGKSDSELEKKAESICCIQYMHEKGKITAKAMYKVIRQINQFHPDIVHAHLGGMVFAVPWTCLGKQRRLLITAHTKPQMAFNKKIEPLLKWLIKKNNRNVIVAAVSKENYILLKNYLNANEQKCTYVNNGVDLNRYYAKEHDIFTFINVARQDNNKNQVSILNAFSQIHKKYMSARLLLVGDGPCHSDLENRVKELQLEEVVSLPGMVGDAENYYAISDIYVQASHREAMPLSVIEAMASGLPVISTDVGGMKDVVKGNGILIQDNDDEALLNAMDRLYLLNEKERKAMSSCSIEMVQSYSAEKMAHEYEVLYQKLLKGEL